MDIRPAVLALVLLLAGCVGGDANDTTPSTSMPHPPAPMMVVDKEVNACPPASPYQTTGINGNFEVKEGYDEIVIAWHTSGEGQAGGSIRWLEEGIEVWKKAPETINSAAQGITCGGHGHAGNAETKKVEPGNYTYTISYTGTVSLHLEVTARSSRAAAETGEHTHVPKA